MREEPDAGFSNVLLHTHEEDLTNILKKNTFEFGIPDSYPKESMECLHLMFALVAPTRQKQQ